MTVTPTPIFVQLPKTGGGAATAANTVGDGGGTIGTDIFKIYTAGSNGAWINRVRFQAVASAAGTSTTATVARVYFSSVTTGATTNANTFCVGEVALPSVSADSTSASNQYYEVWIDSGLDPGYTVLITNHAAPAANTRWHATLLGSGDY